MIKGRGKITILSFLIFLVGTLLLVNVLLLDLSGKTFFADKDFKSLVGVSITKEVSYPTRGVIYDSEGNVLAQDITVYKIIFILSEDHQKYARNEEGNVVLVPDYVTNPRETADKVAAIIDGDAEYIYNRLSQEGLYQVEIGEYGKKLSYDQKLEIEELDLPGIVFEASKSRYYPYKTFASHLLGYVENQQQEDGSYQLVGISGIEGILNSELNGQNGYDEYYSDVYGNVLPGGEIANEKSKNGYNITLTLNNVIQQAVEETLSKIMALEYNGTDGTKEGFKKAWSIVMDGKSGAILGYGSYPSFDGNDMNIRDFNDYCSQLPYEPGSTMKTIIYSAACDLGTFNKKDRFDGTIFYVGGVKSDGYVQRVSASQASNEYITNFINEQIPDASFYEAYCCSYNVGCAVLLEKYVSVEQFEDYVQRYKFFEPVDTLGIDEGDFYGSADWSSARAVVTTSFGQSMSCTALQLIRAYSVFSNGGTMIKPYIIQNITDPATGEVIYEGKREEVGQVIGEDAVAQMLDLMDGVVNSGWSITSAKYKIPGITVGGKSGTAEVAEPGVGYGGNLTIHSIMLGMPIDDPQVWVYVAYQDRNPRVAQFMPLVNDLERTVASVLGLTDTNPTEETTNGKEIYRDLENFSNHTIAYVKPKLEEKDLIVIVLGDGDTVVRQYPEAGSTVITGEKVMLMTNGGGIIMPDMKGWSRKDVTAFWNLTGISIQIDGYGYVTSQSIAAGTVIDKSMTIELKLED